MTKIETSLIFKTVKDDATGLNKKLGFNPYIKELGAKGKTRLTNARGTYRLSRDNAGKGRVSSLISGAGAFFKQPMAKEANISDEIKENVSAVKNAENAYSNTEEKVKAYTSALGNLDSAHRALSLHTVGLTNEQVRKQLSDEGLEAEAINLAMANAGLLSSETELTVSKWNEAAASSGLTETQQTELATKLGLTEAEIAEGNVSKRLTVEKFNQVATEMGLDNAQKARIATLLGLDVAQRKASFSAKALNASLGLLKSTLSMGVMMAISWAIGKIFTTISEKRHEAEEAAKAATELANNLKTQRTETAKNAKEIENLVDEYESLAQGVDSQGRNLSLTNEEYDSYLKTVSSISDIMPNLNTLLDEHGQKIGFVAGQLKDVRKEYRQSIQEAAKLEFYKEDSEQNKEALQNALNVIGWQDEGNGAYKQGVYGLSWNDAEYVLSDYLKLNTDAFNYKLTKNEINSTDDQYLRFLGVIDKYGNIVDNWREILLEELNRVRDHMDERALVPKEAILKILELNDEWVNLTEEEETAIQNIVKTFDYKTQVALFGQSATTDDVDKYFTELIENIRSNNSKFTAAYDGLFDESLKNLTAADYEEKINSYLSTILSTMGYKDNQITPELLWNFRIKFGISSEDDTQNLKNELKNFISEKIGFFGKNVNVDDVLDKLWNAYTENEIKILITADTSELNLDDYKADGKKGFDYKGLRNGIKAIAENESVIASFGEKNSELASSLNAMSEKWKYFNLISGAANGTLYLTNEQIGELVKAFPNLEKKLKRTTKGWQLESSALDLVSDAVMDLQTKYAMTQKVMTSEETKATMQRLNITQTELDNIQTTAQAYEYLANKFGTELKLKINSDGSLDTSQLTQNQLAAWEIVSAAAMSNRATKALNDAQKLGSDDNEKKEKKAKDSYDKKVRDINEKQADADFKYKVDLLTQALDKQAEAIERLSTAYDGFYENDYSSKIEYTNKLYKEQSEYTAQLKRDMDSLLAKIPATSASWSELASSLEDVSGKYFENQRKLLEYRNQLYENKLDSYKNIGTIAESLSNDETDAERIKNWREKGSIEGLFAYKNVSAKIAPKDKIEKEKQENLKLEEEQKRYQAKINEIKAKATDEAKKYDDEQRQLELDEAKEEYEEAIGAVSESMKQSMLDANAAWLDDGLGKFEILQAAFENGFTIPIAFTTDNGKTLTGAYYRAADNKLINSVNGKELDISDVDTTKVWRDGKPVDGGYDFSKGVAGLKVHPDGSMTWRDPSDINGGVYRTAKLTPTIEGRTWKTGEEDAKIRAAKKLFADYGNWNEVEKNFFEDYVNGEMSKNKIASPFGSFQIKLTPVGQKANGGITSGLTIEGEAGREGYIGKDGKLHWFNDRAEMFNADDPVNIINADDMRKIIKYTGNRYFNEPIGNLSSVTALAEGNTRISLPSSLSATPDLAVKDIYKQVNSSFDKLKNSISILPLQNAVYAKFTDKAFYSKLTKGIAAQGTAATDEVINRLYRLVAKNSTWLELSDEVKSKFAELGATENNWSDWVKNNYNQLTAVDVLQTNEMSWDALDTSIQTSLSAVGINSSETWNNFVYDHPMEALELLETSWDGMNNQVADYLDGAVDIAAYGSEAISDIQVNSPDISQQSWDNLQTLIANKIQEIINQINKTFGDNTIDLNFGVTLKGNEHTNPQGDSGSNSGIVSTAEQYLGTPYVWGGTTPSGFDCSGLVQYVFAQNGKHISRTAYTQIHEGTPVDRNSLQPGDAVFFGSSNKPHHVGIYAGNGQFIHAPHTGDVVKYSDLNSAYYSREFCGARRYADGASNAEAGLANVGDEYLFTGANHPTPELIFNKHSNKTYLAGCNGVEHVKLHSGDVVVPYAKTKKMLDEGFIPGNKAFPTGTGNISSGAIKKTLTPPEGKGKSHSYTAFNDDGYLGSSLGYWNKNLSPWKVFTALRDTGDLSVDQNGIYTYKGARLCAATSMVGSPGDVLKIYQADDAAPYYCIVMDEKAAKDCGGNPWGQHNGNDIIEFEVRRESIHPKYRAMGGTPPFGDLSHAIIKIENFGSLDGFDFTDISDISALPIMSDFAQKLQAIYGKLLNDNVLGTFRTNTGTDKSKIANIESLSDVRQRSYSFKTPFTHADGTRDYHVVGENYKPEIMLDKSNGSMFIVDSPMVFDPAQYDVVGEEATQQLNKSLHFHEKGTLSHSQQGYLDTINAFLADGDKYTADSIPWDAEDLSNIAKCVQNIDENTKTLDDAPYLDNSKHITREDLEKYISWYKDFESAKDSATSEKIEAALTKSAQAYDREQNTLAGAMENQLNVNHDTFLAQIKQGATLDALYATTSKSSKIVDEYQRKSAINQINFEREKFDILKKSKSELERLREEAPTATEYAKANESIQDIDNTINSIDNTISDLYASEKERIMGEFEQADRNVKGQYQKGTSYLDKQNDDLIKQLEKTDNPIEKAALRRQIMDNQKLIEKRYADGITAVKAQLEEVKSRDEYADLQEKYDFNFEAMFDADGEFNDYYYSFRDSIKDDVDQKAFDNIAAAEQQAIKQTREYMNAKTEAMEAYDDYYSQQQLEKVEKANELHQRENEILEFQSKMQKAVTSGKESLHNLLDTMRDERNSIKEQLDANKQIDQWLSEDTRALLFNQDDYDKEIAVIKGIEKEANRLYNDYHAKIRGLTEEESYKEAAITAEYNKQVEALQDKLTLAKDQLDVAKKTAAFNNALKERDTQIIMGNRVQNVADPEKLYQLAQEKAKSENTLSSDTIKSAEKEEIRDMERVSDSIDNLISQNSAWIDMVNKMSDEEKEMFADFLPSIEDLTYTLKTLHYANPFWLVDTDNSMEQYRKLVKNERTSHGYDMTFDYEEGLENLIAANANKRVKGANYRAEKEALMLDHDYKTSTDNHNDGYERHKPNHKQLDDTYVLPMNSSEKDNSAWIHNMDAEIKQFTDTRDEIKEIYSEQKLPEISGNGEVRIVRGGIYDSEILKDCVPVELSSLLPIVSGNSTVLLGRSAAIADMIHSPNLISTAGYDGAVASVNEDNSVTYQVGNVTVTTPVESVDDIFRELTRATEAKYGVSNNIRR